MSNESAVESVLLLGSNLGQREKNLSDARGYLTSSGMKILKESSIYETDAWGNDFQKAFLNQVLIVRTQLIAQDLLVLLLETERKLGRTRQKKWEDRIVDIDILFYGSEVIKSESLTVPHPLVHERKFALVPLCEIRPDLFHPQFQLTMTQLLERCDDHKSVKKYNVPVYGL